MSKLKDLINKLCPEGVTYTSLGEICKCVKGTQLNKDKLLSEGYPVINGGINPSGFWNDFNFSENRITISQGGSAGYVSWQKTKFWAGAHCYVITNEKENINYRYLYHVIKYSESFLIEHRYGTTILALASKTVNQLKIPLPPLEVQKEIVRILDSFESLTSEVLSGIPGEIKGRQKQYEYYRNLLLNFKEKGRG